MKNMLNKMLMAIFVASITTSALAVDGDFSNESGVASVENTTIIPEVLAVAAQFTRTNGKVYEDQEDGTWKQIECFDLGCGSDYSDAGIAALLASTPPLGSITVEASDYIPASTTTTYSAIVTEDSVRLSTIDNAIAVNQTQTNQNTTDINAVLTTVNDNAADIVINSNAINANTINITANATGVAANADAIGIAGVDRVFNTYNNSHSVWTEQLNGRYTSTTNPSISWDSLADLEVFIAGNPSYGTLTLGSAAIIATGLNAGVEANDDAIALLQGRATALEVTAADHETRITDNTADIATNVTAIEANATDIATNVTDIATIAADLITERDARLAAAITAAALDLAARDAIEANVTANTTSVANNADAIGSVAVLGVFTSSANVVYTQDATDGKFYTPGNNFGYSQSVIQSWITGGDGGWTSEPSVGSGLAQGVADNAADITALETVVGTRIDDLETNLNTETSERKSADAQLRTDFEAADVTIRGEIEAAELRLNTAITEGDARVAIEAARLLNEAVATQAALNTAMVTATALVQTNLNSESTARVAADVIHTAAIAKNVSDISANAVAIVEEAKLRIAADIKIVMDQAKVDSDQNIIINDNTARLDDHEGRISSLEALHVSADDGGRSVAVRLDDGRMMMMHFNGDGSMIGQPRMLTFMDNPVFHMPGSVMWNDEGVMVDANTLKPVDEEGNAIIETTEAEELSKIEMESIQFGR